MNKTINTVTAIAAMSEMMYLPEIAIVASNKQPHFNFNRAYLKHYKRRKRAGFHKKP